MCDASCSNLKQLAIAVTEIGEQKLEIINLKIENQKLKERLNRLEKGLFDTTSQENVTPDTSDNESVGSYGVKTEVITTDLSRKASQPAFIPLSFKDEPSISTPRRTKRERSHSDENDHTPARKRSLNQNDFGDKPFICYVNKKCLLTFSTKKEALVHARVKHGYDYGCNICSKAFKSQSKLNKHQSGDS